MFSHSKIFRRSLSSFKQSSMTTKTTTTTETDLEEILPSDFFKQILLQSTRRSSSANRQQATLQVETEKLLVHCASLFAQELVVKSASVAQRRPSTSTNSIRVDDVEFVLKHQWPLYDRSAYNQITEN